VNLTEAVGAAFWLPLVFVALMAVAMAVYVILDGYDLGVGVLLGLTPDVAERDTMIASIGPFWDANETWLVLGVGLLLVAFPLAHGVILGGLYLPVAVMLIGLTLRGVAFDFRAKAHDEHKPLWNAAFCGGSLLAATSQGAMLGLYILGFENTWRAWGFAACTAFGLTAGYALLGAAWLVMKTDGALQRRAVHWARRSLWLAALGVAAISLVTPLVSPRIFEKWFAFPNIVLLAPIPIVTAGVFVAIDRLLAHLPLEGDRLAWAPFAGAVAIFLLAFYGLGYSLFPYLVTDRITLWDAASDVEALEVILVGALIALPAIGGYTVFSYRVFRGKATTLAY
jgi:cytochrome d ubiquinol oxidase subunit II